MQVAVGELIISKSTKALPIYLNGNSGDHAETLENLLARILPQYATAFDCSL